VIQTSVNMLLIMDNVSTYRANCCTCKLGAYTNLGEIEAACPPQGREDAHRILKGSGKPRRWLAQEFSLDVLAPCAARAHSLRRTQPVLRADLTFELNTASVGEACERFRLRVRLLVARPPL
jgi:hypothetical protein